MSTFDRALDITLGFEGGFVDDPSDPGGATKFGITQNTLDRWNRTHDLPEQHVKNIDNSTVRAIYYNWYWLESSCHKLPPKVGTAHFDCAVNTGPKTAVKILQRAVRVADDGIVGPVTLDAVRTQLEAVVVEEMLWRRLEYYRDITRDEQEALTELAAHIRSETEILNDRNELKNLVTKAEGLKFLRFWIPRLLTLRAELGV